jgi:hypothetical protein
VHSLLLAFASGEYMGGAGGLGVYCAQDGCGLDLADERFDYWSSFALEDKVTLGHRQQIQ